MRINKLNQVRKVFNSFGRSIVNLIMYDTYTPSQNFDMIRISVLRDVTKIWIKSFILKMSRTLMFQWIIMKLSFVYTYPSSCPKSCHRAKGRRKNKKICLGKCRRLEFGVTQYVELIPLYNWKFLLGTTQAVL